MRYHYKKPNIYNCVYGKTYICDHPVYSRCTLYLIDKKGLAVIQQRFNVANKHSWWGEIDDWLVDHLYLHKNFKSYFDKYAKEIYMGIYPTVSLRQIMWALRIKPIKREPWETLFDRKLV